MPQVLSLTFLPKEVFRLLLAQLPDGGRVPIMLQQRKDVVGQDVGVGVRAKAAVSKSLLKSVAWPAAMVCCDGL